MPCAIGQGQETVYLDILDELGVKARAVHKDVASIASDEPRRPAKGLLRIVTAVEHARRSLHWLRIPGHCFLELCVIPRMY